MSWRLREEEQQQHQKTDSLPRKQQVQLEQGCGFNSGRCKVALEQKKKLKTKTVLFPVDLQNRGWDRIRRKPENIRRRGAFGHPTACTTCLNSPCQAPALGTFNLEVKQHLHEAVADGDSRPLPSPSLPAGLSLSIHY